ncbi:MAG TPA: hypothetical protein P5572_05620 [Phycisphaerae bacterium]|nr:hypothetical protein [Phycisphaerae bacterium]
MMVDMQIIGAVPEARSAVVCSQHGRASQQWWLNVLGSAAEYAKWGAAKQVMFIAFFPLPAAMPPPRQTRTPMY